MVVAACGGGGGGPSKLIRRFFFCSLNAIKEEKNYHLEILKF